MPMPKAIVATTIPGRRAIHQSCTAARGSVIHAGVVGRASSPARSRSAATRSAVFCSVT